MYTRTFKLCLNAGTGSAPFINVSQTDRDEVWLFELYTETGERYIPSSGAIIGIKSDGHGIANTGTVDSEGRVVITETEQMTAAAGRSIFELSIDGLTHGTANFIVNVEKKPIDGAIMSDSDLSLISQAVDSAAVIVDVIGDGDPSEVIGEHVDAWLDNHPEATTTVEDGAITAPKINQSLWDKLLVSEEASGNPASFDDGADDVPVSSLKVNLEPIQTGSGDPSPSNVRPIIAANGKNILQVTGTTQTINGVTFTVNADGTVKANGTASSAAEFVIKSDVSGNTYAGMILSGCPNGGGGSTYRLFEQVQGSPWTYLANDGGSGVTLPTTTYATVRFTIRIESGVSVNNLVFKPMIRPASITDATYQPYQGIMVDVTGKNTVSAVTYGNPTNIYAPVIYGATYTLVAGKRYIFSFKTSNTGEQIYRQTPESLGLVSASAYSWFCDGTVKYFYGTAAQSTTITNKSVISKAATGSAVGEVSDFMVEAVEDDVTTPSTYEPYTGTSYPYTLGQSVYGGSVDLATGVLTVTRGTITLDGSEAWGEGNTNQGFYTSAHTMLKASDYTSVILCDKLKTYERMNKSDYYEATNGITGYNDGSNQYPTQNWIYAKGGGATTPTEFKTWLASNPLTVVYELANPTTVQLTPQEVKTLLGYNNISSSGTVDVIYHADTKLYVDKMTAVDNAVIAPTEEGFTATRNYTVNDLLIVADTLYKVTANIANGGTITPNSNVTQTTLGALIKALS